MDALGKPFDPTRHEAMMEVEDPSQPPGRVVRVAEDGYTIHDRLLRPARVFVVDRHPKTEPSSQMEGAGAERASRATEHSS
jgi:molecular chaperone GrpE